MEGNPNHRVETARRQVYHHHLPVHIATRVDPGSARLSEIRLAASSVSVQQSLPLGCFPPSRHGSGDGGCVCDTKRCVPE